VRPRNSLLWQALAVMASAIVFSQVAVIYLQSQLVNEPRAKRSVSYFIAHLQTIGAALELLEYAKEEEFMRRIASREGIYISHADGVAPPPGLQPAPDRDSSKALRERIRETFGQESEVYVKSGEENASKRMLWVKLPLEKDEEYWVGFPQQRITPARTLAMSLWIAAGLLVALGASLFLFLRFNRPLQQLTDAAEEIGKGLYPAPLPEKGPAEIGSVARAFNRMNERLQRTERERATFLAGVSHDLRTPLGHLGLAVEINRDRLDPETRHEISADLEDMSAIVEQFIDFARGESDERLYPVDLSELANECVDRVARSGARVRCDLQEMPLLQLRPVAIQRLVGNLLNNAARHAGGEIEVRTALDAQNATLSVLDRGPGIPPEMVEHLKQPFTRKDDARSGSSGAGLGLAIADRIARLHGGTLALLPREGGGLEARITLPVS
jgi:two-component system osmolarity sensor histidine kinase EnvZ